MEKEKQEVIKFIEILKKVKEKLQSKEKIGEIDSEKLRLLTQVTDSIQAKFREDQIEEAYQLCLLAQETGSFFLN